jgi:hypothetical protein
LDYFCDRYDNRLLSEETMEPLGDYSRLLSGPLDVQDSAENWNISKIYIHSGSTMIGVTASSPSGDMTLIVVELAKRLVDPTYSETQRTTAQTMQSLSSGLSDQIQSLSDARWRLSDKVADTKLALGHVQDAVGGIEDALDSVKEAASVEPMTCYQATSVLAYQYDSVMTYEYDSSLSYERQWLDEDLGELNALIVEAKDLVNTVNETAMALRELINASAYLPVLDAIPGDEDTAVSKCETAITDAQADYDSISLDYDSAIGEADGLMAEGKGIVDDVSANLVC